MPIDVIVDGSVNALRLQDLKAPEPIVVTPSGIVSLSNDEHPSKQWSGIAVTFDGILTILSDWQPLKASPPNVVNDSGSVTTIRFALPKNTLSLIFITGY